MNHSSANIKLLKTKLSKTVKLQALLGRLLEQLLKTGLALMKNIFKPFAKGVLITLGLTAAASATDAAIKKRTYSSGTTTLIVSNKEKKNIMKLVKSLD